MFAQSNEAPICSLNSSLCLTLIATNRSLSFRAAIIYFVFVHLFLTLIIDDRLYWKVHLKDVKARAGKKLGATKDTSTHKKGEEMKIRYLHNDGVINFMLRGIDLRNRHKTSTENIRTDTKQGRETSIRSFCKIRNGIRY
jgi:hypothetical protein